MHSQKIKFLKKQPLIIGYGLSSIILIANPSYGADNLADSQTDFQQQNSQTNDDNPQIDNQLFLECMQVQLDSARLACFDQVAHTGTKPSYLNSKKPLDLAKTLKSTIKGKPQVILADDQTTETDITDTNPTADLTKNLETANQTDNYDHNNENNNTANNTINATKDNKQLINTATQTNDSQNKDLTAYIDTQNAKKSKSLFNLNLTNLPKLLNYQPTPNPDEKILTEIGVSKDEVSKYTPLSLAYDLDKNSERGIWTARPHNPMYLLPVFISIKPNYNPQTPNQAAVNYTPTDRQAAELKLQVSLKTKVAQDLFGTNADLWFGYTQQSHWQVYNYARSRPFRATDYEPEVFLTQPAKADLPFGGRLRMLGVGAVHHSNGQSDPLSRSWNRLYLMGGAEWNRLTLIPRVWTRVKAKETSKPNDNPDIIKYIGYGDLKFIYDLGKSKSIAGTLRYNPFSQKGAVQLDYVRPITGKVQGYVQFFHGYGESIIDYNHKGTSFGVGIMLGDWKGL